MRVPCPKAVQVDPAPHAFRNPTVRPNETWDTRDRPTLIDVNGSAAMPRRRVTRASARVTARRLPTGWSTVLALI
jgi:hypothetical protein